MNFDSLGLKAELLRAIGEQGYARPTPVQLKAIPPVLEGRDVMASAQTGTGKTAAFTLPLLQRLSEKPASGPRPRALILTPTRELAAQIQENFTAYGRHLPVRSMTVFGGVNINPQISWLRRGVDVLIATPGRLMDHMQRRTVDLSGLEVLVLDEADRMLDMGFLPAIERIIKVLPAKRQTLLFSATFPKEITTLARRFLVDPVRVETAAPNSTVEAIAQHAIRVDQNKKRELLSWLIGSRNWRQVLVFTRTKHGANRLARQLESDGLAATAIHGNKTQGARTRALADFKNRKVRVLVATDVAARGLDIDQLPHVVNYDIPQVPEDYIHRIGRTGRAGRDGLAMSLVSGAEQGLFANIRKLLGTGIPTESIEGFEPAEPVARQNSGSPARRTRGDDRKAHNVKTGQARNRGSRHKELSPGARTRGRRGRPANLSVPGS